MDSSDFSNKHEEDEDIRFFREEYPDIYDFVLKLIDEMCDEQAIRKFIEEYDKETFDDIQKMIVLKEDDKDAERLKEEYPEEFYNAIRKMVHRIKKHPTPAEEYPKRTKYKKGDFIGQKYEVYDILGEGGFGIVYLVYSHETKSAYALKTFRDEYLEDVTTRERFKKEAQVWIDLERHPYLVRAYFVDEFSGRLFIAMEHIASDETGLNTLEGYLRIRPPDLAQSLRWAIQFCHGMEHAYSRGIKAHRDIKPANIMIGQDKAVKISDFGLAGVIDTSKRVSGIKTDFKQVGEYQTMEGTGFGTPTHMPPEQFINAAGCDERSDIYSFGIVLFQMISGGKLPFYPDLSRDYSNEDIFQTWYLLHNKAPVPRLDSTLSPIIFRCLEKNPINRQFSFKELRKDLESLLKKQTGEVIKVPEQKEMGAWELCNRGTSLSNLGMLDEAVVCYDHAIKIAPLHVGAWYNKGHVLNRLGKHSEAIACYDRALTIMPSSVDALINKGEALGNINRFMEALTCCNLALKIDIRSEFAWNNKGAALYSLGKYQESIACYNRALEINPRYAGAWSNKGNALYSLGKYQEAIACCDRAIEINPGIAEAWYNKGVSLDSLDKSAEAITCCDRALEINPRDAKAWHNKGNALYSLGKYQEAIVCCDKALEINPRFANAWVGKGIALGRLGKYQDEIACYNRALEINPRYAGAWYNKATVEDGLGLKKEAIFSYKNFIELAPTQYAEEIKYTCKRLRELEER